ncbi:DNA methylase N-4 [Candidatus Wolfebacteria bacterium RIFOXYD12_FULL_48_21]|uniref:Methyltransferase n=1 Tax=Candidatus Wolfebacteria bacterium RIFOXYD1_FULL_48_65 TaxID=1802561 RepID=A0A1F8E3L0_9BACT|nr:MAG: DNA methylase N-4 [Candidatus Wolfebacteria bacterium RIFOXYD12_FULL_48_21]OGM95443.1 MAG: DNA methylase N-4 [Candidatus Wolfebacteria bacterium RIFOXYD1_FULL_48_65]OGM97140.1 MAG: DNA methylase N-4 [Candidatus Wolfebacteria bacterium RIFOXYD2_FULL_48_11]
MTTKHEIINGDARSMGELPDKSVQLIVTSPPYWQLKDYGSDEQIGFNDSYETYINHLNLVWDECYRVLEDGCRLCINIGDQFARSVYYGRYKIIPIRTEIIKFCESIGFDYMGAIIWQKNTTMNTTGGATIMGSFPYPRNGIIKLDYEFILIFKKQGVAPKIEKNIKEQSKLSKEEWNQYFQGHWNFGGVRQDNHIAMFPEELPKRLIKMFSFIGDIVLDPFLGSGTTSLVAKNLGRNSVGYEINPDFLSTIKNKIGAMDSLNFDNNQFVFTKAVDHSDFGERINMLPYIFKDPHKLDKKIDVKKMQFGSKIDKNSKLDKEESFSIKEIISPELVKLSNNLVIRLIGIRQNPEINGKAVEYLSKKTKGKKLFIKFDAIKYDSDNNLLAYLYLQNKTFINAHLLKEGLALPDTEMEYKYKDKFIKLTANYYA